ncbi:MAG: GNAT family N-acetyltransferase [Rubrivivax sp.]
MKLATFQGPALVLPTFDGVRELRTPRTLLRQWQDSDLDAWVEMNADPEVRRHFPSVLTRDEALAEAGRIRATLARRGWGAWALEIPGELPFAGFVGLIVPAWSAHFTPAVEIGWRLPRSAWGRGYASEAAAAAAAFAFAMLALDELVSITVPANEPSRRVMQRIGMVHDAAGDFDHPRLAPGHPMSRHVLYRMQRPPA